MDSNIYEYMHNLPIGGQSEAVDALTITATGLEGKLSISLVVEAMRDYLLLQEKKPFTFRNAKGWSRGSVSYAEELKQGVKLWSILMVKGEQSEIAFTEACKLKDLKITRIDIAVDILMLEPVVQLPRKLKDTYKGKFDINLIESLTGDTLYCGSREGGVYVRIYDKSEEYNYELGRVWRFEVEFKKGQAPTVFGLLRDNGIKIAQDVVWTAVRSRDLPTPKIGQTINLKAQRVTFSTSQMKLAWLGRQVRPTVEYLMNIGKKEEVYKQLGFEFDNGERND